MVDDSVIQEKRVCGGKNTPTWVNRVSGGDFEKVLGYGNCISEWAAEVRWRGMLATDVITAKGVIKTMITNARHHAWGREDSVR